MSRVALAAIALVALAASATSAAGADAAPRAGDDVATGAHADDAYARWQTGDAAGAAPLLAARARADGRWSSWLDAGLAAADAGDRGHAVGWLLAALKRAPERAEPREALAALDAAPPPGWLPAIGPLAWPGLGWPAIVLAGLAGAALGAALVERRARRLLPIAAVALALLAPGAVARWHDASRPLAAIADDTRLLDSAGEARQPLAAGTLVWREPRAPWPGRRLVRTADGTQGYVAVGDLVDE